MPYILFCQGHVESSLLTKFSKLGVGLGTYYSSFRPIPELDQTIMNLFSDFRTHSKRCLKLWLVDLHLDIAPGTPTNAKSHQMKFGITRH